MMGFIQDILIVFGYIIVAGLFIWWAVAASENRKKKELTAQIEQAGAEHRATFTQHTYGNNGAAMAVDIAGRKLCLAVRQRGNPPVIDVRVVGLGDVLASNIRQQNIVLFEAKRKSGLGRALVGGALFGGAGAVVGAVSGNKQSEAVTTSIYELHLTLNDLENPHFVLVLNDFASAKRWQALFEVAFGQPIPTKGDR